MNLGETRCGVLELTSAQLDRLLPLAKRSHDGSVQLESIERDGLPWVRIDVLLTDMGSDVPPLHTFFMDPTGRLAP